MSAYIKWACWEDTKRSQSRSSSSPERPGMGPTKAPGNGTYCIRVSSQFGGGICGTLDATQTVYLTSDQE